MLDNPASSIHARPPLWNWPAPILPLARKLGCFWPVVDTQPCHLGEWDKLRTYIKAAGGRLWIVSGNCNRNLDVLAKKRGPGIVYMGTISQRKLPESNGPSTVWLATRRSTISRSTPSNKVSSLRHGRRLQANRRETGVVLDYDAFVQIFELLPLFVAFADKFD